ncbi:uncharacterized protein LOC124644739 [Helicoverpa zea]|uniref:uncharacterized protein LOC124630909 n=1 Tax=Helicoverpa zea TaxID=7113 RepID=UPI001F567F4B|nr:uncharacterized protein LOC124630909 [Helicoverpa zea]XP_047022636.1 uncharacterized protein LOC124632027 [Helicoverpa zea]XP_047029531.1 uncharacterized protein LOC124637214 [Helicoverpa zea]XP_047036421.1 uncharacterized protein LOC124642152 [Helicoverpa zea]XP_047038996.1 uncharacterized protein LOC124643915 [Helicoverpa zea]XP_047039780.1 uncharacterized protein LOC124644461 [Helicoverpa zea]XP_047039971.1 uncharacterized protein LOC124644565 [Helicoverpa zea]XP_047040192.1 uncharacte
MSEPEIFSDADSKCEVSKVGLPMRCPPFCPEEPAVWFAQIEGQFVLGRISSDTTKFYTVVTQLETKYAMQVKDIITKPPETNKYEKLKTELINRLSASQEKRIQQLLIHEELGDRRPSQFLRHLQNLAGPAGASDFVKSLWTNRLPQNIQTVIASQIADLPVEKLAEIADRVYDIVPCTPQVAATSASTSTAPDLVKEVSELTKQVARLSSQMNSKWRGRSRSRSQSRHNQRRYYRGRSNNSRTPQPPPNHPHCYYHYTFGDKANKCRQPCTFTSENAKGGR